MSKLSVNELTDEAGTGAPSFPNGVSVTGAALTDPEITGGVYLGGTGSANYLDDYEEGTFTPTLEGSSSNPSASYSFRIGRYTKVGRAVHVDFNIGVSSYSGGSGELQIGNLPFVSSNGSDFRGTVNQGTNINYNTASATFLISYSRNNTSTIRVRKFGSNHNTGLNLSDASTGGFIFGTTITYFVD